MIATSEIEKNEYNLNIPRYIDSTEQEDLQDIEAHLLGDIPTTDIDALNEYWKVFPTMRKELFDASDREGYRKLKVSKEQIKETIFDDDEFINFRDEMETLFESWKTDKTTYLKRLDEGNKPKTVITDLSSVLLDKYTNKDLIDKYDIYQHLMTYWNDVMQDDCYIISQDGWIAERYRIIEINKKKKEVDKGWTCDLVPKELVINRYFSAEQEELNTLEESKESAEVLLTEMEEEHSGEDGCFNDLDKVNKGNIKARLKELKNEIDVDEEISIFNSYLEQMDILAKAKKSIKTAEKELDDKLYTKYPQLTNDEAKQLVVDDKWMSTLENDISNYIDEVSQHLANRIKELANRYENTLPYLDDKTKELETKVEDHLKKMGFVW
jgi:type I restriction enzyme M protein